MKKRRKLLGVILIILAMLVLQLPHAEADAAASTSDFVLDSDGTTLLSYKGSASTLAIPNGVETIATDAFSYNTTIESISFPDSLKTIQAYAFWKCTNLHSVSFGNGITSIGDFAFANAKGLTSLVIPPSVSYIGCYAFQDCVNLKEITIPYQVYSIEENAFDGCFKLVIYATEGSYPYSYALKFYERQKEFPEYQDVGSLPEGTEDTVGDAVTGDVTVLPTAKPISYNGTYSGSEVDTSAYMQGNSLGSVHVVGNSAVVFMDNTSPSVYVGVPVPTAAPEGDLAEGEVSGGDGLGEEQEPVTEVVATDSIPKYTVVDDSIIADQAYYQNEEVSYVTIPSGIREIGQFSYARSSIETLKVSEGVEKIGYGAFYHCDDLKYVELPDSLMCVEPNAFTHSKWVTDFLASGEEDYLVSGGVLVAYRGELSEIRIPEGVRVIAAGVFADHEEITGVEFPASVRVIGEEAFRGCNNLSEITFFDGVTDIKDRAFFECGIVSVTVPASLVRLGLQAFDDGGKVIYLGSEPENSHELTAERLSNTDYRLAALGNETGDSVFGNTPGDVGEMSPVILDSDGNVVDSINASAGDFAENVDAQGTVSVVGVIGAQAYLEGADDAYTLTIASTSSDDALSKAIRRVDSLQLSMNFSGANSVYRLSFTDRSGIPITRLGRQFLQIAIPVPTSLAGEDICVVALDRNGQLERIDSQIISVADTAYVSFSLDDISVVGFFGTGSLLTEDEVIFRDSVMLSQKAEPVEKQTGFGFWIKNLGWRLPLAVILLCGGIVCLLIRKKGKV